MNFCLVITQVGWLLYFFAFQLQTLLTIYVFPAVGFYWMLINDFMICYTKICLSLHEKCPNTELFVVRIQSKSPYSVRMQENTDRKQLPIWTLFTQYFLFLLKFANSFFCLLFFMTVYRFITEKMQFSWKQFNFSYCTK